MFQKRLTECVYYQNKSFIKYSILIFGFVSFRADFLVVLWRFIAAACLASGNFILCFPEESRSYLPKLMPMFYENLQDNIPSVRSGAAQALSCVAKTYGNTLDSMCR